MSDSSTHMTSKQQLAYRRHLEGRTNVEIAKELKVTHQRVTKLLAKGKLLAKKSMQRDIEEHRVEQIRQYDLIIATSLQNGDTKHHIKALENKAKLLGLNQETTSNLDVVVFDINAPVQTL